MQTVRELCIVANKSLTSDIRCRLEQACSEEKSGICRDVLGDILENLRAAKELGIPICQDTGMAVVFCEVGNEIYIEGDPLEDAVNEGIRQGYTEGLLRCSVVKDPIRRGNTEDNTPGIVHIRTVKGDTLKLTVAPKGFGSENMSRMKMFTPSATPEDIVGFVAESVSVAGSNPCPPVIVGVGIGGDFEYAAYLAKKALCRPLDQPNPDEFYRELEQKMLERVNRLGIGSQGFGGTVTALGVNIEQYPTHIAGLPVAVNMGCHVTRHASAQI